MKMKKKKSQTIQETTRQRLRSLNILGITTDQLGKAKAELQKQEQETQSDSPEYQQTTGTGSEKKKELNITKNYVKMDSDVVDQLMPILDVYEQSVYIRLYRLSYGHGQNYCTVGYQNLCDNCNVTKTGAIGAVKRLIDKGWIKQLDFNHAQGTTYRVYLPIEKGFESKTVIQDKHIRQDMTENGIFLKDIPSKDIPLESISYQGIPCKSTLGVSSEGILSKDIPTDKLASNLNPSIGVFPEGILPEDTNIDHKINLKDSLSQDEVIDSFYKCIGHSRITKEKRERARECIKELKAENFSMEDIQLAVEWTLKNNEKKPYDFSIVKHTIGKVMAEKERSEAMEKQRLEEENKAILEKQEYEQQEKEREKCESYKKTMSPDDRENLRQKAKAELKSDPQINEDFISDMLIGIKENEILKRENENL